LSSPTLPIYPIKYQQKRIRFLNKSGFFLKNILSEIVSAILLSATCCLLFAQI
jgi:hypothetical protein